MAIRKVTDCQVPVLWLLGMKLTGGVYTVAIRNETDCKGPVLWL